ncbi:MAG: tRNA uridine-5-carboxymethylaminomethyl(34) synthesis enzyme MnmG [Halanaerobiales bacterium]|nr:tRNA uridine-5-carboxymethylaminomethyl(34) synthesis enzyme MnmG [Halanaerobiales bacterium]
MFTYPTSYDVIIIGAGHAGCEAGLASARMGMKTLVLTISLDHVAFMPCNPSIGGPAKAHIVREIDALGGEMGKNIDATSIQIRMLNTRKGPAVHSLRAQADKIEYHRRMKQVLENTQNLDLKQAVVEDLVIENEEVKGVITRTGVYFPGNKVILTSGTFLRGKIIIGEATFVSGPNLQYPANELSHSLKEYGIRLRRFKTGTPPRVDGKTLDFDKMEIQEGDLDLKFSFNSPELEMQSIPCWLTYTNNYTHDVIHGNMDRAPLFCGDIEGTGPRYCPSIEDKVTRFPDKERHQVFLEPESLSTNEYYVAGLSTSLPYDVQLGYLRTIPGMENVEIARPGYAIEYDCLDPTQLKPTLETKVLKGLYTAGQVNGTSGYEEAAGQGLMAGINAVLAICGDEPLVLKRSEAYLGVLIDDLVTKGTNEPYRMLTSRAEYRLILRQDNADLRLSEIGFQIGLLKEEEYQKYLTKREEIQKGLEYLSQVRINPTNEVKAILAEMESGKLQKPVSLVDIFRRPELSYDDLRKLDPNLLDLPKVVKEQLEIEIKYEGYINRQMSQIQAFKKMEDKILPVDTDYVNMVNMRKEAREKLDNIKPHSLGQASRISGVSPADISVLMIYLEKIEKEKTK